jgi:hypothetical protein
MLISRFAQIAAALALLTLGLAAPAHAQLNKQIISGTWYEDRASVVSSSSNTLTLTFTQTPTSQFLNITNVSCFVEVSSAQIITAMTLQAGTTSGASDLDRPYAVKGPATSETQGTFKYYSIVTNQVFFKFGPGRYPSIFINAPSTGSALIGADCTIVGNLTDS